ncbi:hypothetical protein H4219_005870, partial [Mycoemilia scoparia]
IIKNRYLSPIKDIPGPYLNSLTWVIYFRHILCGTFHQYLQSLHVKYGPIVRYGPRNVSIGDLKAGKKILSSHDFRKPRGYSMVDIMGVPNLLSTRDPKQSQKRRRQIGPAFSMSKLLEMEALIIGSGCENLIRKLYNLVKSSANSGLSDRNSSSSSSNTSNTDDAVAMVEMPRFNYTKEFLHMACDVAGELVFGKSFGMLDNPKETKILEWIEAMTKGPYIFQIFPIIGKIPFLFSKTKSDYKEFIAFVDSAAENRRTQKLQNSESNNSNDNTDKGDAAKADTLKRGRQDILQMFLDAKDPETQQTLTEGELRSELVLQILAGTDTISNTLTWTIHLLLEHPKVYSKLVQEIRSKFPPLQPPSSTLNGDNDIDIVPYEKAKKSLPYLEAVIHESMRLCPAGGAGMPRLSPPPNGISICGYHIPPKFILGIFVPYIHRNPQYWENPNAFYPERFLSTITTTIIHNSITNYDGQDKQQQPSLHQQLIAFSSGVRICPGRNLAMIQLFVTLTNLLRNFDLFVTEKDVPVYHRSSSSSSSSQFSSNKNDGTDSGKELDLPYIENVFYMTLAPAHPERDCWVSFKPAASVPPTDVGSRDNEEIAGSENQACV